MKISCFEPETKVTISVSSDENKIALESEVVGITDQGDAKKLLELCKAYKCPNFVVIKGIMSNGKMLNFDGYQLRSKVTSIYKDRPYRFSSLRICNTTLSVGDVHVIFSGEDVESFNRRREFRVWFGANGFCLIGESNATHEVLIKDIAEHSITFIISKSLNLMCGDSVELQFHERAKNEAGAYVDKLFKIRASVIRIGEIGNNENDVVAGALIMGNTQEISKLIFDKQRAKAELRGTAPR